MLGLQTRPSMDCNCAKGVLIIGASLSTHSLMLEVWATKMGLGFRVVSGRRVSGLRVWGFGVWALGVLRGI